MGDARPRLRDPRPAEDGPLVFWDEHQVLTTHVLPGMSAVVLERNVVCSGTVLYFTAETGAAWVRRDDNGAHCALAAGRWRRTP